MSFVLFLVYAGGVSALSEQDCGLWRSVLWPWHLGKHLAMMSFRP